MTERTRAHMKQEFQDGERPSGSDFADVFDSFLSKQDDGLSVDASDGTLALNRGLRIGGSSDATLGTLRFDGANLQIHDGTAFVDVGTGSGGVFQTLAGGEVAYSGGNLVGIGAVFAGAAPTYGFEVDLAPNGGAKDQVRFGEAVIYRGAGAQASAAHFAHRARANNQDFAIRQRQTGEVNFNAPASVQMFFSQGGTAANTRMTIAKDGEVLIGTTATLTNAANTPLHVGGNAIKSAGGGNWATPSDARLKEDVADYVAGLDAVRRIRPVTFTYNGKAGTVRGARGVGVIGQEIETVMPETVSRVRTEASAMDGLDELRIYDGSALVYVLVNAVRELADRVDRLEAKLAAVEH